MKAARQHREYKTSLTAREAYAASSAGSSTSHDLSISYIPSEVTGGIYSRRWNLDSPSFNLADQTHLPTILRSLAVSHTSVNVFQVLPPPPSPVPWREQARAFKKPSRGRWMQKRGREDIDLGVQHGAVCPRSMKFHQLFPLWSISIWRVSTDIVFLSPSDTCIHLQLSVRGQSQIAAGEVREREETQQMEHLFWFITRFNSEISPPHRQDHFDYRTNKHILKPLDLVEAIKLQTDDDILWILTFLKTLDLSLVCSLWWFLECPWTQRWECVNDNVIYAVQPSKSNQKLAQRGFLSGCRTFLVKKKENFVIL